MDMFYATGQAGVFLHVSPSYPSLYTYNPAPLGSAVIQNQCPRSPLAHLAALARRWEESQVAV